VASIPSSRSGLASAAALLLAGGGLVAFVMGQEAGREPSASSRSADARVGQGPARRPRPPELTTEVPYRGYSVYPASTAPGADGATAEQGEPQEPDATRELARAMEKLVSDLEWNSNRGLKEPLQQAVAPMPDPWRPPAESAVGATPVIDQVTPARASTRGGAKVTIRGQHLRPASVMFGDAPASIVGGSDREVTVLVPPSPPGAVTIALTNTDGTYALVGNGFTFAD